MNCEKCNQELAIGDFPYCPHDSVKTTYITSDDIPGGYVVRHGACWPDGTPRKFYSKSEIKQVAHEQGWTMYGDTPKPNQRLEEKRSQEREARRK